MTNTRAKTLPDLYLAVFVDIGHKNNSTRFMDNIYLTKHRLFITYFLYLS